MIVLKRNGVVLALPAGVSITQEIETTIFNRNTEVADFSYPVDIPLDEKTIEALGYPHVLANPSIKHEYLFDYIEDGIFIDVVTVAVTKVSLANKTCSIAIIGAYGTFGRLIGAKKVNELKLGGPRIVGSVLPGSTVTFSKALDGGHTGTVNYTPCNTHLHMKSVSTGAIVTDYMFPAATDLGNNIFNTHTGTCVNCINTYDQVSQVYIDPMIQYLLNEFNEILPDSDTRHFWVPFFKLSFVLRKCFEEMGFTCAGTIWTDPRFTQLLLYNTYAINKCSVAFAPSGTTQIYNVVHWGTAIFPRDHVPDMPIIDFINELAKLLNLKVSISIHNMTVSISEYNISSNLPFINMSESADPTPDIIFEEQDFNKGYNFSFEDDGKDSNINNGPDVASFNLFATLNNRSAVFPTSGMAVDDVVYIKSDDMYHQWDGVQWSFLASNTGAYKTMANDGGVSITSKFMPVRTKYDTRQVSMPGTTSGTNFVAFRLTCPESNMGIEGEDLLWILDLKEQNNIPNPAKAVGVSSPKRLKANPRLVNWHGMLSVPGPGGIYPFASSGAYTTNGASVFNNTYHLTWSTPGGIGLANQCWKTFTDQVKNTITLEQKIHMDVLTGTKNFNDFGIKIKGLQYVVRKATITKPFPSVSSFTLVRI